VKDDRLYLLHMLERCQRVAQFISGGREAFEELQDAVIRNIEVIGEAAKRVSPASREQMPQLEWKRICGMRDVLIHDYIGVDLDQVWNVASNRIPELERILKHFCSMSIARTPAKPFHGANFSYRVRSNRPIRIGPSSLSGHHQSSAPAAKCVHLTIAHQVSSRMYIRN
jgi:uncharacterized protein with HEPN domain